MMTTMKKRRRTMTRGADNVPFKIGYKRQFYDTVMIVYINFDL